MTRLNVWSYSDNGRMRGSCVICVIIYINLNELTLFRIYFGLQRQHGRMRMTTVTYCFVFSRYLLGLIHKGQTVACLPQVRQPVTPLPPHPAPSTLLITLLNNR